MPVEWSGQDDAYEDPLTALGDVPEPGPCVLDAARERLWSLMAAEMLTLETGQMDRDEVGRDPASLRTQGHFQLSANAEPPPQFRRRGSDGSQ